MVAEASDGEEAVALVALEKPDVAVFDIQMPRMNGLEATRRVKMDFSNVPVLVVTAFDDDPYIFASLQAGASGYLLKTASSDEIVQAVHAVADGETALSPAITKKLVQRASSSDKGLDETVGSLTGRELEVLRFAGRGLGNKQIGVALAVSDRTVQGHLANIYAKLHVSTHTEAVLFAVREKQI